MQIRRTRLARLAMALCLAEFSRNRGRKREDSLYSFGKPRVPIGIGDGSRYLKTSLEAEGTSLLAYDSYFQIFDAGFANRWLSAISRSTASF
jgi:hypothetical protein